MKIKRLASSLAVLLVLGISSCNNDAKQVDKPGLEKKVEEPGKVQKPDAEYFKSFITTSGSTVYNEPYFSKDVDEKYGKTYYYELKDTPTWLNVTYHRPNPNVLFEIQKVENGTEYIFSHNPDCERLRIDGEAGYFLFLISNNGMAEILSIKDKKINRVSYWAGKDIYYGAIDNVYYDWESIDPQVQAKFEDMAKDYMERVFRPVKEKLHVNEVFQIYRRIKES
ncbi:MAG: hypothetical protein Q8O03_07500 [Nanoarchaeota archaeon]|nr:hypothetical protein [Nanoarchaeota archaeon]